MIKRQNSAVERGADFGGLSIDYGVKFKQGLVSFNIRPLGAHGRGIVSHVVFCFQIARGVVGVDLLRRRFKFAPCAGLSVAVNKQMSKLAGLGITFGGGKLLRMAHELGQLQEVGRVVVDGSKGFDAFLAAKTEACGFGDFFSVQRKDVAGNFAFQFQVIKIACHLAERFLKAGGNTPRRGQRATARVTVKNDVVKGRQPHQEPGYLDGARSKKSASAWRTLSAKESFTGSAGSRSVCREPRALSEALPAPEAIFVCEF